MDKIETKTIWRMETFEEQKSAEEYKLKMLLEKVIIYYSLIVLDYKSKIPKKKYKKAKVKFQICTAQVIVKLNSTRAFDEFNKANLYECSKSEYKIKNKRLSGQSRVDYVLMTDDEGVKWKPKKAEQKLKQKLEKKAWKKGAF